MYLRIWLQDKIINSKLRQPQRFHVVSCWIGPVRCSVDRYQWGSATRGAVYHRMGDPFQCWLIRKFERLIPYPHTLRHGLQDSWCHPGQVTLFKVCFFPPRSIIVNLVRVRLTVNETLKRLKWQCGWFSLLWSWGCQMAMEDVCPQTRVMMFSALSIS